MKIREALKKATEELSKSAIDSSTIDAKVLLAFVLDVDTNALFMKYEDELKEEEQRAFEGLVCERKSNRPVAYITGHREFYSLDFLVNENVLIPRPETEILVDESLNFLKGKEHPNVLDICTGSGNIPITLCHETKKEGQEITAFAFDISPEALEVAEANKNKHEIKNLVFFQYDLFQGICQQTFEEASFDRACPERSRRAQVDITFDLITANPPYVPMEDKPLIAPDVIDYEPHIALFENDNGCRAIFKIIEEAEKLLKQEGLLLIEISSTKQSEYITQWFQKNQWERSYSIPTFLKDYAGINRFLSLTKKSPSIPL